MRINFFTTARRCLAVTAVIVSLQSCIKDKCTSKYAIWEPVYKTKAEVRANIKNNPSQKIEQPGKIYTRGNYIFLNEINKGVHIIDNTNPVSPVNLAFIDIPGNRDMAVKGNVLYADLYTDLVAIDISNPQTVTVKSFTEDIFPERAWPGGFVADTNLVIVDWYKKDSVVDIDCNGSNALFDARKDVIFLSLGLTAGTYNATSGAGTGGSLSTFAIVNDYLYGLSGFSLNVLSISNPDAPAAANRVSIGEMAETVFPFNNRLFIGTPTGMFIYDLANPASPARVGSFSHARVCDPVIADNNNAFVTLRSGTTCGGFTNQLDVLDITTITNPVLMKTYTMDNPHGLSKDGNTLIICDGASGIKFFNAANINAISPIKTIPNIYAIDVIAQNGLALVMAREGLYQYDYSDLNNIRFISKLAIQ